MRLRLLLLVAVSALLACACGGKKRAPPVSTEAAIHDAVDRYANVDMPHHFAVLWTGVRPLKTLENDLIDRDLGGWVQNAMPSIVIPRMTEFLDGAAQVTVPVPMTQAHAMLLDIAKEYRDEAKDLLDAANSKDATKFKAAHARMLASRERYGHWQAAFDTVLREAGQVVFKEVPRLADPPTPAPTKLTYCGAKPCPCKDASAVHDKLTACNLTEGLEIQGAQCAPDLVRFRDDGSLLSCVLPEGDFYRTGPATFHPNGQIASASSNVIASPYDGLVCGPGPARWFDDGKYEACQLRGDASVGGIDVVKGATASVVFYPGGKIRYVKYGAHEKCFDLTGMPAKPCAAPAW